MECRKLKNAHAEQLFYKNKKWCLGRDLNPHSHKPTDFKSVVYTNSTTKAFRVNVSRRRGVIIHYDPKTATAWLRFLGVKCAYLKVISIGLRFIH